MAGGEQAAPAARAQRPASREPNLAYLYQEVFTAIVRLRTNRQSVTDVEAFRVHMRQLIAAAEKNAQARGYTLEDIRLATFAAVAFLDESILNLRDPVFADWPRRPMQEELFGGHVAGEVFFQTLDRLLGRGDSTETADVLEVFLLSLLLGYRGKYGIGGQAELDALIRNIADKIRRIRKDRGWFSPAWMPVGTLATAQRDPWIKRLAVTASVCLLVALALFAGYRFSLASGVGDLVALVTQVRS